MATDFQSGIVDCPPRPLPIYHPVQAKLWSDDYRFKAVAAGRRSGKTLIAIREVMRRLVRIVFEPTPWEDPRFGIGAPTRQQVKQVFWEKIKRISPRDLMLGEPNESTLSIRFAVPCVDGRIRYPEIVLAGLDAPQRIEGRSFDFWELDEFADMHPEVLPHHVRPTLSDRAGALWATGVPNGRNHFWELTQDYQSRPECGYYWWPSRDILDVLQPGEIEQARRDLDPRTFRQEYEASFEEATGRIYYAFDRNVHVHEFTLPNDIGTEGKPWEGGMDFNVNPMTAVRGWSARTEDKGAARGEASTHVYVWDEMWLPTSNTHEAGTAMRQRCEADGRFGVFKLHPDPTGAARKSSSPSGQTDHTILRTLGYHLHHRSAPPPRRDRYNSVNTLLRDGSGRARVHIHPRCRNLIRCLDGLIYKEGTNDPDKAKCPDMDHVTDAIGYWIEFRHRLNYRVEAFEAP